MSTYITQTSRQMLNGVPVTTKQQGLNLILQKTNQTINGVPVTAASKAAFKPAGSAGAGGVGAGGFSSESTASFEALKKRAQNSGQIIANPGTISPVHATPIKVAKSTKTRVESTCDATTGELYQMQNGVKVRVGSCRQVKFSSGKARSVGLTDYAVGADRVTETKDDTVVQATAW